LKNLFHPVFVFVSTPQNKHFYNFKILCYLGYTLLLYKTLKPAASSVQIDD